MGIFVLGLVTFGLYAQAWLASAWKVAVRPLFEKKQPLHTWIRTSNLNFAPALLSRHFSAVACVLFLSLPTTAQCEKVTLYKLPNAKPTLYTDSGMTDRYLAFTAQPTTSAGREALLLLSVERESAAIEADADKIIELVRTGDKQGDPVAQTLHGLAVNLGWHTHQVPEAAYAILQKAAVQGEGQAEYLIGEMVENGVIAPGKDALYELNTKKSEKLSPSVRLLPVEEKPKMVTLPDGTEMDFSRLNRAGKTFNRYLSGQGEGAHLKRAWLHYQRAEKMGSIEAQYRVGQIIADGYFKKIGIEADRKAGYPKVFAAAKAGWPRARALAGQVKTLIGGYRDPKTAKAYIEPLLAHGYPDFDFAYVALAIAYFREDNLKDARRVIHLAWKATNERSAAIAAAHSLAEGLELENAEHAQRILYWAEKAYALQDPKRFEFYPGRVFTATGKLWLTGKLGEIDLAKGKRWTQRGMDENSDQAYLQMGLVCGGIYGSETDHPCQLENYQQAANLGNAYAILNLGSMYAKGQGVKTDQNRAFVLFNQSAELGLNLGMLNTAIFYYRGTGVEQSFVDCYAWSMLAKERKSPMKDTTDRAIKLCGAKLSAKKLRQGRQRLSQLRNSVPTGFGDVQVHSEQGNKR